MSKYSIKQRNVLQFFDREVSVDYFANRLIAIRDRYIEAFLKAEELLFDKDDVSEDIYWLSYFKEKVDENTPPCSHLP